MNLFDLQENKFAKLRRTLSEVFESDFNFDMDGKKLVQIQEATAGRIATLRENGVDVSHRDYQKLLLIAEGLKLVVAEAHGTVTESADLDQAEVLLAAKQMGDDLQKMAETLASMQVEELMSIHNAMKEQVGIAEADAFNASAEQSISAALEAVKAANEGVNNALLVAQGQAPAQDMEMDGMDMEPEMGVDDMDMDMEPEMGDEFAGDDSADMDTDIDGREMKEDAYLSALKMVKEQQSEGKVSPEVLKQAFSLLKK